MRHLHALKEWLPNDLRLSRRLIAYTDEIDAMMVTSIREVSSRRGIEGVEPQAGRLRLADDLGVRAADDVWD